MAKGVEYSFTRLSVPKSVITDQHTLFKEAAHGGVMPSFRNSCIDKLKRLSYHNICEHVF